MILYQFLVISYISDHSTKYCNTCSKRVNFKMTMQKGRFVHDATQVRKLFFLYAKIKVKNMQRSGTEAIRTQIQPSKPKREITNITNSRNTQRTYGQPSEQIFPKRLPLNNQNGTKNNITTHKVKRHQKSDTKNRQQSTTTKPTPWNGL